MKPLTVFLTVFWTLGVHAQGLIWSVNHTNTTGRFPMAEDWHIAFDHVSNTAGAPAPSLNPVTSIFVQRLNTNDTGDTFFANAVNSPRFTGFVAGLTDGTNGFIRFQAIDTSSWSASSEQLYLRRSSLAPDLAGYNITQIGFRVNNFYDCYFEPENTYNKTLEYSLDFYGAPVPEPGTWALLTLGSALLWSATRRRRK